MNKQQFTSLSVTLLACSSLSAAWSSFALPNRDAGSTPAFSHLSDGRVLYAHHGTVYRQDTFGNSTLSEYTNAPDNTGSSETYSFIASNGFAGSTVSFGAGPVYTFDSGNLSSTFSSSGPIQSYYGVSYTPDSALIVGANGGSGQSEVGHYTDAGVYTTVIEDVSLFSGGITLDGAGNLYVIDNDDLNIYSYSAAQVAGALIGLPLQISDGTLITSLGVSGSIAVDSQGRIFATGYQLAGIQVYDMNTGDSGTLIPNLNNANYSVETFSDGSDDYVAFVNWESYSPGAGVLYGYDLDGNVPVPEPSAYALIAGALAMLTLQKRRRS